MSRKGYPSDLMDQINLRLPTGMRNKLKDAARANNRSMNAETLFRIEYTAGASIPEIEFSEVVGRQSDQMPLRVPDGMRDELKATARANGRSLNQEIIRRLAYAERVLNDEKPRPLQPQDKYVVRLPDGLRDRLKASAEENNRTMNAEIIFALERHLGMKDSDRGEALIEEAMKRIRNELVRLVSAN